MSPALIFMAIILIVIFWFSLATIFIPVGKVFSKLTTKFKTILNSDGKQESEEKKE